PEFCGHRAAGACRRPSLPALGHAVAPTRPRSEEHASRHARGTGWFVSRHPAHLKHCIKWSFPSISCCPVDAINTLRSATPPESAVRYTKRVAEIRSAIGCKPAEQSQRRKIQRFQYRSAGRWLKQLHLVIA